MWDNSCRSVFDLSVGVGFRVGHGTFRFHLKWEGGGLCKGSIIIRESNKFVATFVLNNSQIYRCKCSFLDVIASLDLGYESG